MTSLAIKAAAFVGGVSTFFVGNAVFGIHNKASLLGKEKRGQLGPRILETAQATLTSRKIADKESSQMHVDLVSRISSKKYAEDDSLSKRELNKVATSYFAGYLVETTANLEGKQPFLFRYTNDLPVCLPKIQDRPYEGFIFSGAVSQIHDSAARQQLLDGEYVYCPGLIPRKKLASPGYDGEDNVIITGTTDDQKCRSFQEDFMRDMIMITAGISSKTHIDPLHPLSDTPVFEIEKSRFNQVGDLSEIPEATKKTMRLGSFTLCDFYALQKTRLSRGSYKEVGAVVVGVTDSKACRDLSFGHMRTFAKKDGSP